MAASTSINPTFEQRKESRLDLVVAGTNDAIVMVEAGAKEVSEEEVVQAFEHAHAAIKEIVAAIDALAREAGKKKVEIAKKEISREFYREVEEKVYVPLAEAMRIKDKLENYGVGRSDPEPISSPASRKARSSAAPARRRSSRN